MDDLLKLTDEEAIMGRAQMDLQEYLPLEAENYKYTTEDLAMCCWLGRRA